MPWKATCPMSERERFIGDWLSQRGSISGICRVYGISRKTGNKWIGRFKQQGRSGLEDKSRASRAHPNATDTQMAALVIAARQAHPTWGPKKLRRWLEERHDGCELPALSTMGDILKRAGLVEPRRRSSRLHGAEGSRVKYDAPNAVWCIDYKGQFRLGNGELCYPLTISDGHSRFLLSCDGQRGPRHEDARTTMDWIYWVGTTLRLGPWPAGMRPAF